MNQAKFANGNTIGSVQDWIVKHNEDYGAVRDRLTAVRNVVLRGPLEAAGSVLEKAYTFAVMSIRTKRDRHERAFTAHYSGDVSLKEASLMTVYGGQKFGWIQRTQDAVDWEDLVIAVRSHVRGGRYATLLEAINDNLIGVAHRKGGFMLAMSGLWEYMCIDSNVASFAGYEDTSDNTLEFDSAKAYLDACSEICEEITGGNPYLPPFIVQWAIYDFENGHHADHLPFFREVIGW